MGIYISHIFNAFVENQNYKKKIDMRVWQTRIVNIFSNTFIFERTGSNGKKTKINLEYIRDLAFPRI